jgi:hypothetical protein
VNLPVGTDRIPKSSKQEGEVTSFHNYAGNVQDFTPAGYGYCYDSIDGNSEDKAVVLGLDFMPLKIHTSINRETPGSINR